MRVGLGHSRQTKALPTLAGMSALRPKADLPADLRTTPAASFSRTPPSRPRAACDGHHENVGFSAARRGEPSFAPPWLKEASQAQTPFCEATLRQWRSPHEIFGDLPY